MRVQMAYVFTRPMLVRIVALSPQIVMTATTARLMYAMIFNVKMCWIAEREELHAVTMVLPARRISATWQQVIVNIKQIASTTSVVATTMMPAHLTNASHTALMALV